MITLEDQPKVVLAPQMLWKNDLNILMLKGIQYVRLSQNNGVFVVINIRINLTERGTHIQVLKVKSHHFAPQITSWFHNEITQLKVNKTIKMFNIEKLIRKANL